jgi:hypothetical protein
MTNSTTSLNMRSVRGTVFSSVHISFRVYFFKTSNLVSSTLQLIESVNMTSLLTTARAIIAKRVNSRAPVHFTPPEKEAVMSATDVDSAASVTKQLHISDLVYQRDWERVFVSLFDNETGRPRTGSTYRSVLSFEEQGIGCTLLHFICRYQPPLQLVEAVVETWPSLSKKTIPATKQTALHVACQYGSRSDVVKFLLEIYGEAAMMQDINGRLPLHLACRPELPPLTQMDEEDEEKNGAVQWIKPGNAVVRALCGHSPKAANAQDKDGCNPLELALTADDENVTLSDTMFLLLLETSKDVWDLQCRLRDRGPSIGFHHQSPYTINVPCQ